MTTSEIQPASTESCPVIDFNYYLSGKPLSHVEQFDQLRQLGPFVRNKAGGAGVLGVHRGRPDPRRAAASRHFL